MKACIMNLHISKKCLIGWLIIFEGCFFFIRYLAVSIIIYRYDKILNSKILLTSFNDYIILSPIFIFQFFILLYLGLKLIRNNILTRRFYDSCLFTLSILSISYFILLFSYNEESNNIIEYSLPLFLITFIILNIVISFILFDMNDYSYNNKISTIKKPFDEKLGFFFTVNHILALYSVFNYINGYGYFSLYIGSFLCIIMTIIYFIGKLTFLNGYDELHLWITFRPVIYYTIASTVLVCLYFML